MEGRFGQALAGRFDFGAVRVHTGAEAAAGARALDATAFTLGHHVVFGAEHSESRSADRRLIAHELAHVVQQSRAPAASLDRQIMRQQHGSLVPTVACPATVRAEIGTALAHTSSAATALSTLVRRFGTWRLQAVPGPPPAMSAVEQRIADGLRSVFGLTITNGSDFPHINYVSNRVTGIRDALQRILNGGWFVCSRSCSTLAAGIWAITLPDGSIEFCETYLDSSDALEKDLTIIHEVAHAAGGLRARLTLRGRRHLGASTGCTTLPTPTQRWREVEEPERLACLIHGISILTPSPPPAP